MSANALKNAAKWVEWGVFSDVIQFLDDQTAMVTIRIMLDVGADLNFGCEANTGKIYPDRVIEAAARRGNFEMIELLLRSGAKVTHKTLILAVSSGNHNLMRMLLERGANVNSHLSTFSLFSTFSTFSTFTTTPLAEAIRLRNPETTGLLQRYDTVRLDDDTQFSAAIVAASEVGDITFIERLVTLGGHARANEMGCALAIAIKEGQDKAATILIDAGANLNKSINGIGPPIIEAISEHNAGLVHLLLEAGAHPDHDYNYYGKPLHCAVEWGDHSIVKTLILAGAVVNMSYKCKGSPLTLAVERQNQALVQLLLDAGADLNRKERGFTALDVALHNRDISMAFYLLDRGADLRDTPELGKAMVESPEFFELLLEKHRMRPPYFSGKFGCNALIHAIELGDEHAIRIMLERGLDANSLTGTVFNVCSPFGRAIINSTVDVIELFLQNGCNPNSIVSETSRYRDTFHRSTGFLIAIGTRNVSKVKLLHRYGADVNFPAHTNVRRTPLQEAAAAGSTDIIELLIRLGAEVNAPAAQRTGGTALQFAAIGGYIPIACLLLNFQADVNAPASRVDGRMALEGAAEHGRLDMLQVLLNAGAGNGGKDQGQFTRAIDLARDHGLDHIIDFLEDYLGQNQQEDEPVMPADRIEDDFGMWNPNGGSEIFDIDPMDRWMVEGTF